jgi:HK97 family phage portal protein
MFDFLRRRLARRLGSRKDAGAAPLFAWTGPAAPRWTARRYDQLADEGFRRNVVAFRCVRLIAQGAASARWLLYAEGGREHLAHPLLDLLARPNPLQGGAALFETLYGHFLIAGNAYLEAVGPERGPPRELHALRPDRVAVLPGAHGLPAGYEYTLPGRKIAYPADPLSGAAALLHLKAFHPLDDWYGLSPIEAAAYAIDQHNAAAAWNQALLQNGARPSGALVFAPREGPATLTDQQFERLKGEIAEQYGGARNAGRPMLLEGGLDWKEMALSPKDMDFAAGRLHSTRDIAAAYGVPPMLIGIPGDATYANYREARLALWEDTILPFLDFVADQLNNWLSPRFGAGLSLAYDADALSALGPRREELWARVGAAPFLTANEKRAAVGYGPVAGGDALSEGAPRPGRAAHAKEGGRRDQPCAPAGTPEGGQWTDGGGGDDGGGGGSDSGADSRLDPLNPVAPLPPAYKRKIVKQADWEAFNGAVAALPGITPMERYAFSETFAAEGGLLVDPDSGAASGISRQILDIAKTDPAFDDLTDVADPADLTVAQRARIYRWYFDKRTLRTVGGGAAHGQIDDKFSAAALADVLFREGGAGGTRMIRSAANETLRGLADDERRRLGLPDAIPTDGAMGPQTFDTFAALSNAGHGAGLREKLSDLRQARCDHERDRNDHFRFRFGQP